jgi:ankyrin repeat protein
MAQLDTMSHVSRTLSSTDTVAGSLTSAIQTGDLTSLRRLLAEDPELARVRIISPNGSTRSLLHIATDWPGHFPNVAATIATLAAAGADVDARTSPHPTDPNCVETPLHWAASSNDVAAVDALLDAGANIEATGAIFTGGAPLSDAVVFANWNAARRLVERGATPTWWQAAALGMLDLVRARWQEQPPPTPDEITRAFWHACRAAHQNTAAFLLERGADPHWVGWDHKTPLRAADESGNAAFISWLRAAAG